MAGGRNDATRAKHASAGMGVLEPTGRKVTTTPKNSLAGSLSEQFALWVQLWMERADNDEGVGGHVVELLRCA